MKKSIFLISLLMILVMALFAACGNGNGNDNDTGDTGQNQQDQQEQPPADDPQGTAGVATDPADPGDGRRALPPMTTENIELVFTHIGVYQVMLDLVAQAFMELHPNITVHAIELNTFYYSDNMHLMAADGMLPDVFFVEDIVGWTLNGWLMDISELVENDPRTDLIGDSFMHLGIFDGVRTALPVYAHPILGVINVDYFDRFNEPIPDIADWNWNTVIEIAERISRPNEMMFGIGKSGFFSTENYLHHASAIMSGTRGRYGYLPGEGYLFCQDWIDLIGIRNDLSARGVIDNASADQKYAILGENVNLSDRGFAGISFIDFWEIHTMLRAPFDIVTLPFPVMPGGRQPVTSDMAGISAITPHPREAYEFLKFFFFSPDAWNIKYDFWAETEEDMAVSRLPNHSIPEETHQRLDAVFGHDSWRAIYHALVHNSTEGSHHTPGTRAFARWRGEGGYWWQLLDWSAPQLFPADVAGEFTTRINEFYRSEMEALRAVTPTLNRFTW